MYYIIRVLILAIVLVPLGILVWKKVRPKGRVSFVCSIIGLIVLGNILFMIPYETPVLRFDSPEDAFSYSFSDSVILNSKIYNNEEGCLIEAYTVRDEAFLSIHIFKDAGGWIAPNRNSFTTNMKRIWTKSQRYITIIDLQNSELSYIRVTADPRIYKSNNRLEQPVDNKNSKFERYEYEYMGVVVENDYAVVDLNDGDYQLKVDGETIHLNEQGNQIK